MRSIRDKAELIRQIRVLKKIRRDFDVVNTRCQNELARHGFEFMEFVEPVFGGSKEKEIRVLDCKYKERDYGVLLSFGMEPTEVDTEQPRQRFWVMKIDVPELYKPLTPEQIEAEEKRKEEQRRRREEKKKKEEEQRQKKLKDIRKKVDTITQKLGYNPWKQLFDPATEQPNINDEA